jgi:cardiolipin synthase
MEPVGGSTVQVLWDEDQSGCSTTALTFRLLLQGAGTCLRITTAYFTPDESMLEEICATRQVGVEVQILVPGAHADKDLVR